MDLPDTITAVVATHFRAASCQRLIDSIREHHPDMRIVVVNDSGDLCDPYPADPDDRTLVIRADQDAGLSAMRNRGIMAVTTPYAVVFDDDHFLRDDEAVPRLLRWVAGGEADVATGRPDPHPGRATYAGWFTSAVGTLRCVEVPNDVTAQPGMARVDYGENFIVASTSLLTAKRWDERYVIGGEHLDWFIDLSGSAVVADFAARIGHDNALTSDEYSLRHRTRGGWRAMLYPFMAKRRIRRLGLPAPQARAGEVDWVGLPSDWG